ncbi:MAG TPA: NAD-dependent epimerase/dehydratase family protein [Solirubrobacteraceae bacterium]|jgi:UDP-glucose 4-epimerase
MRFLVTGGAGFIGSNLVDALLVEGHEVRVLDNFSTGHRRNIRHPEIDLVEGDLRSFERVSTAMRKIDVVFHQGALPSVPRSIQDPLTSNAVNVEGTLNVILAARDHGVRRLVLASSSSVYGDAPGMPRREDGPVAPLAPYAVAKLAAERYAVVANSVFGLESVAIRYFNVFGDYQDPSSGYAAVIPKFIRLMLAGSRPTIFGDGTASRDFTHVDNVVQANLAAAAAPDAPGRAINVATNEGHTVNELVETLNRLLSTDLAPIYADRRPGDVPESRADISLAEQVLGYNPTVDFETGLQRTIAHLAETQVASAGQVDG